MTDLRDYGVPMIVAAERLKMFIYDYYIPLSKPTMPRKELPVSTDTDHAINPDPSVAENLKRLIALNAGRAIEFDNAALAQEHDEHDAFAHELRNVAVAYRMLADSMRSAYRQRPQPEPAEAEVEAWCAAWFNTETQLEDKLWTDSRLQAESTAAAKSIEFGRATVGSRNGWVVTFVRGVLDTPVVEAETTDETSAVKLWVVGWYDSFLQLKRTRDFTDHGEALRFYETLRVTPQYGATIQSVEFEAHRKYSA